MPRPRVLSSTPSNTEIVETASSYTFKLDLVNISERVGEIISCERVGERIIIKAKAKGTVPESRQAVFTVSFE